MKIRRLLKIEESMEEEIHHLCLFLPYEEYFYEPHLIASFSTCVTEEFLERGLRIELRLRFAELCEKFLTTSTRLSYGESTTLVLPLSKLVMISTSKIYSVPFVLSTKLVAESIHGVVGEGGYFVEPELTKEEIIFHVERRCHS